MESHSTPCNEALLESLLRGQLHGDDCHRVESHLEYCSSCRTALDSLAAEPDEWNEVREQLSDLQVGSVSSLDGSSNPCKSPASSITKFLGATDDPQMLGRLGGYEIAGIIGSGGMGIVLKGWDRALNRFVAIKVLAPHLAANATARKRFSREAQAAAAVVHDNVIAIHGVSEANGLPYLVMPYIRGQSLQKRLDLGGPLRPVEVLRVGHQIAAGLAAAHAQGLVHRDIKPANILLEDGVERLRITDFGLARAVDDSSLTQDGILAGTPEYMSPEQARGETVGPLSDLFSLGSVLYAACTGRSPFRSESSHGALRKITDDNPRLIRERNAEVPAWLEAIIFTLLDKTPEHRFASAKDVAELMLQCLAHVQHPTVMPLPKRAGDLLREAAQSQKPRRRRTAAMVVAALVVGAGLISGVALMQLPGGTAPNQQTAVDAKLPSDAASTPRNTTPLALKPNPTTIPSPLGYVRSITFARDGSKLLVGINDAPQAATAKFGTVQVWDVNEKKLEAAFPVQAGVFSLDMSPDRRYLAVGSGQGSMEVLSVDTGKPVLREQLGKGDTAVRFSPRGAWLVAGTQSGSITAWNATKNFERSGLEFENGSEPTICLGFSDDETKLAAGGGRFPPERSIGTALVFETKSGRRLTSTRHAAPVMDVTFVPGKDGSHFTTACLDGFARTWDIATGESVRTYRDKASGLVAVRHLPEGRGVVTLGPRSGVSLWTAESEVPEISMRSGQSHVTAMAVSPNGSLLASGGHDQVVTLWSLPEGMSVGTLDANHDGWLPSSANRSLAVSADGERFIVGREDGGILVREVGTGRTLAAMPGVKAAADVGAGHFGPVHAVAFVPTVDRVISGGADGTLRVWNIASGRCEKHVMAHVDAVASVAVTSDGKTAWTGSADSSVAEWDLAEGTETQRWEAHASAVTQVQIIDDARLLTTCADGTAKIWRTGNHDLLMTCDVHRSPISAAAVSPDGSTIATGSEDGHLLLWSARTGWDRRALRKQDRAIRCLTFSPDGTTLISGADDAVVRVWDVGTLEERQAITAHRNAMIGTAFLGKEPLGLMSAGGDGLVKRWNVVNGTDIAEP